MTDDIANRFALISSIGLDPVTACAAARAGITKCQELKLFNPVLTSAFGKESLDGLPAIKGHSCPVTGYGYCGVGKILALGSHCIKYLCDNADILIRSQNSIGFSLGLSDYYIEDRFFLQEPEYVLPEGQTPSEVWREQTWRIASSLTDEIQLNILKSQSQIEWGCHAVIGKILTVAHKNLINKEQSKIIIGAIDSYVETQRLIASASLEMMFTEDNPTGFFPGEAAVFGIIDLDEKKRLRLGHCRVDAVVWQQEGKAYFNQTAPDGSELVALILRAIDKAGVSNPSLITQVLVDLNGLQWYAKEWGATLSRLAREGILLDQAHHVIPAAMFGETGAATGMLGLCMIDQGYQRKYFSGFSLLLLTSLSGVRSVIICSDASRA